MTSNLKTLISESDIEKRVIELAAQISADYDQKGDVVFIGILKGAFIFLADLSRRLSIPHIVDFIAVSSYDRGDESSGTVRLVMDVRTIIEGKHVVIVEDIVDSGRTLHYLLDLLRTRKPLSIRTCVLTLKERTKVHESDIDYLGFEIPDEWVVGYGLDYDEQYRTLPYIGAIQQLKAS